MTKRFPFATLLLSTALLAASVSGQTSITGAGTIRGSSILQNASQQQSSFTLPTLPQTYVNNLEWYPPNGVYDVTIVLGQVGSNGTTYPNTLTGLQQAHADWAAAPDQWWHIAVLAGDSFRAPGGTLGNGQPYGAFVLPVKSVGTNHTLPTKFLVVESTTPLPEGQTVCSHGIQDNVPGATDVGVRNPGCANDLPSMWTLSCTAATCSDLGADSADAYGNPVSHIVWKDVHFTLAPGISAYNMVNIGQLGDTATTASDFGLDRYYISTDQTDSGASRTKDNVSNGIAVSGRNIWLTNGYIEGLLNVNNECHAIWLANSQGPIKIVHNWVEGCAISLFAGGAMPGRPGGLPFSDLQLGRNRLTYPAAWLGTASTSQGGFEYRKNCMEIKEGQRMWAYGNICENVDATGGQSGPILSRTVRASSMCPGTPTNNYQTTEQDFWEQSWVGRNACRGPSVDGRSGGVSSGCTVSQGMNRVLLQNSLFYNIATGLTGCGVSGSAPAMNFSSGANGYTWGPINASGTVSVTNGSPAVTWATGTQFWTYWPVGGVTPITLNGVNYYILSIQSSSQLTLTSNYGGTTGTASYSIADSGCVATRDAAGQTSTIDCSGSAWGKEVGGQQTDMNVGDPVAIYGCADASFDTVPSKTQLGPLALAGTLPTALQVIYANPGTALAQTSGCSLDNNQGFPRNLVLNHNTFIGDYQGESSNTSSAGPTDSGDAPSSLVRSYAQYNAFENNLWWGYGQRLISGNPGEGTSTQSFGAWDPGTLTEHYELQPGRPVSQYTEYPGAGQPPIVPAQTIYGPGAPGQGLTCTGSDPTTGNCVGIYGLMSTSTVNEDLADWTQYRLCQAGDAPCSGNPSLYSAGQQYQANDGTDMAASMQQILSDEENVIPPCPVNNGCGATGPYPDNEIPPNSAGIPSSFFGMHDNFINDPPLISFGTARIWDNNVRWDNLANCVPNGTTCTAASNNWHWTNLDNALATIKSECATCDVLYTWGGVPAYANGCKDDGSDYYAGGVPFHCVAATAPNHGDIDGCGNTRAYGCWLPPDIAQDGSGANQYIKDYFTFLATHLAGLNPANYATVLYWDGIGNEYDRDPCIDGVKGYNASRCANSWTGNGSSPQYVYLATYSQFQRIMEDLHTIVPGLIAGARIFEGATTGGVQVRTNQNMMYCNYNPSGHCGTANHPNGISTIADGLGFHGYVRDGTGEGENMAEDVASEKAMLKANGNGSLPIMTSEDSWGCDSSCGTGQALPDYDMQAGFTARFLIASWSAGVSRTYWYRYDSNCNNKGGTGTLYWLTDVNCNGANYGLWWSGKAYNQTFTWMVGSTLTKPCSNIGGNIWTCNLTSEAGSGSPEQIVWWSEQGANQSSWCSGSTPITHGTCDSKSYTYPSNYAHYYTLDPAQCVGGCNLAGGTVQITGQPILLTP